MQKIQVKKLFYDFVPKETISYNNPPPIDDETEHFYMNLNNGKVTFTMKEHLGSVEKAIEIIDNYLKAWEIDIGLRFGNNEATFEYKDAEIIDLNPPSLGNVCIIAPTAIASGIGTGHVKVHVGRSTYPYPPKHFKVTPDVSSMWHRYNMYLEGKETLAAMAYFCYTVFISNYGTKKQDPNNLNISKKVLNKLSYLSTRIGNEKTARKWGVDELRPHTKAEVSWLKEATKILIRRIGESQVIPKDKLKQITMNDLPPLN